jgi:NADH-quinone oxidoreductase subunit E
VAAYLGMPPVAACTRWQASTTCTISHPVGKYKIAVCTNLPCALSGGVHAADYLKSETRRRLQ